MSSTPLIGAPRKGAPMQWVATCLFIRIEKKTDKKWNEQ